MKYLIYDVVMNYFKWGDNIIKKIKYLIYDVDYIIFDSMTFYILKLFL